MNSIEVYDSSQKIPKMFQEVRDISRYRYLLTQLIRRDILVRYKAFLPWRCMDHVESTRHHDCGDDSLFTIIWRHSRLSSLCTQRTSRLEFLL